jgi:mannose-6-phosphate isomerase
MSAISLYPLRFEPIYQYRLWGGRRLSGLLSTPLPADGPVGEAWVLSDRVDHQSLVANGTLKGKTIGELMEKSREQLMGKLASRFHRFPLLLKFLDAQQMLSVQVHPSDAHPELLPPGETGKTEAWVVIEAGSQSCIYAGLKPDTTASSLHRSLGNGTVADQLQSIAPKPGDAVFIPAGTVHTLGGDIVVFEVQQNSDVTFRLYDWDHVDAKTGKPRPLQVAEAFEAIDFEGQPGGLSLPIVEATSPVERERLFDCDAFRLQRLHGRVPFPVGATGEPRVLVCLNGAGRIDHDGTPYEVGKGDVWLLPADLGKRVFHPDEEVTLLQIAIPTLVEKRRQPDGGKATSMTRGNEEMVNL